VIYYIQYISYIHVRHKYKQCYYLVYWSKYASVQASLANDKNVQLVSIVRIQNNYYMFVFSESIQNIIFIDFFVLFNYLQCLCSVNALETLFYWISLY